MSVKFRRIELQELQLEMLSLRDRHLGAKKMRITVNNQKENLQILIFYFFQFNSTRKGFARSLFS